jgi:hypothetical protein
MADCCTRARRRWCRWHCLVSLDHHGADRADERATEMVTSAQRNLGLLRGRRAAPRGGIQRQGQLAMGL